MRLIRSKSYRRMPWKNGGGETTEIAVSPQNASLEAFDWRVSMARVESDGPFSAFPGIDRTLAVLEGQGIELDAGRAGAGACRGRALFLSRRCRDRVQAAGRADHAISMS